MMLAASLAGIGFGAAGVHIPHACAYPIAGLKHEYQPPGYPDDHGFIPHGQSVIVTAPAAFRFTYEAAPERHRQRRRAARRRAAAGRRGEHAAGPAASSSCATSACRRASRELGYDIDDVDALVDGALKQQRCSWSRRARRARRISARSYARRSGELGHHGLVDAGAVGSSQTRMLAVSASRSSGRLAPLATSQNVPTAAAAPRSSCESPTAMHSSRRVAAGAHVEGDARAPSTRRARDQVVGVRHARCPGIGARMPPLSTSRRCAVALGLEQRVGLERVGAPRNRCETSRSTCHGAWYSSAKRSSSSAGAPDASITSKTVRPSSGTTSPVSQCSSPSSTKPGAGLEGVAAHAEDAGVVEQRLRGGGRSR